MALYTSQHVLHRCDRRHMHCPWPRMSCTIAVSLLLLLLLPGNHSYMHSSRLGQLILHSEKPVHPRHIHARHNLQHQHTCSPGPILLSICGTQEGGWHKQHPGLVELVLQAGIAFSHARSVQPHLMLFKGLCPQHLHRLDLQVTGDKHSTLV